MTARSNNYVGLVPAKASVEFPFVGNTTSHDGIPFVGNSTCSSYKLLLFRNQICSSGEVLPVGNFTRDLVQILQRHDSAENDPCPSQSKIALIIHEIPKIRQCMDAVFDHLNDFCDSLDDLFEKKERGHRANRDFQINITSIFIDGIHAIGLQATKG